MTGLPAPVEIVNHPGGAVRSRDSGETDMECQAHADIVNVFISDKARSAPQS